jgi:hypothetical protein
MVFNINKNLLQKGGLTSNLPENSYLDLKYDLNKYDMYKYDQTKSNIQGISDYNKIYDISSYSRPSTYDYKPGVLSGDKL